MKIFHSHPTSPKTQCCNLIYCSKKRFLVERFCNPRLQFLLAVINSAGLEANTAEFEKIFGADVLQETTQ